VSRHARHYSGGWGVVFAGVMSGGRGEHAESGDHPYRLLNESEARSWLGRSLFELPGTSKLGLPQVHREAELCTRPSRDI
jgi:hypothetical protein